MSKKGSKVTVVPAVEKALNILEYLAQQNSSATLKEISTDLGIPSVSTYRIVKYLNSRGYVRENPQAEGEYGLGFKLLDLSHLIVKQLDLNTIARPILRELSEKTGQTTQLGVLRDYGVMYIEQVLPMRPVNIMAELRSVIPVNVSASGKVLVAYLPPKEQEDFLLNADLPPQTLKSITDIGEFKQELNKVKERGYATDNEEYARGIGCVAAPIMDHLGAVVAAVGITGHISTFIAEDGFERLSPYVVEAANKISAGIGYNGIDQETAGQSLKP